MGKLSLNVTSFSKETTSIFGNLLEHTIKTLVPVSHCMPLTVEYLNSASLAPKKDYETNRSIKATIYICSSYTIILLIASLLTLCLIYTSLTVLNCFQVMYWNSTVS